MEPACGDKFLKWLAPKKGQRWLDIGCGGGATEQLMLSCAPSYLAGVDPSEDQLAFAQQRSSLKTAEFRKADAMELPFGENEFDAATMALVLFFVPEPRRGVAEMLRKHDQAPASPLMYGIFIMVGFLLSLLKLNCKKWG